MQLSSPKIKKLLIFSQRKTFFIFREMELFKKISYISVENFSGSKNKKIPLRKKFLYFAKWNFLTPSFNIITLIL